MTEPLPIRVQTRFARGKEKYVWVDCEQPFATAIIDPQWPYTIAPGKEKFESKKGKGRLSGFVHDRDESNTPYKQKKPLSIEEIGELPITDIVGGYVFLWTVGPFLINGNAQYLLQRWGFEPVSVITWTKYDLQRRKGYGGVGFWFLGHNEFVVVGKRPSWPSIRTGKSSSFIKSRTVHSEKPYHVHELCEQRFPGPYIEVFGRKSRDGWTVLGNEAPGDGGDIRDSMARVISGWRPQAGTAETVSCLNMVENDLCLFTWKSELGVKLIDNPPSHE